MRLQTVDGALGGVAVAGEDRLQRGVKASDAESISEWRIIMCV